MRIKILEVNIKTNDTTYGVDDDRIKTIKKGDILLFDPFINDDGFNAEKGDEVRIVEPFWHSDSKCLLCDSWEFKTKGRLR